jgi:vacuolar-type H+-ATPase subunit D/Vma8
MRAMTMEGLCIFLDVNTKYFNQFEIELKDKKDKISKDFSNIITRIREVIRNQKFEGAAAGFLNANIIARDLGLKDSTEIDHTGNINVTFKEKE